MQGSRKTTRRKGTATNCFQVFRQYEFASEFAALKSRSINVSYSVWKIQIAVETTMIKCIIIYFCYSLWNR